MSESAVARANVEETFACARCSGRGMTATQLAYHVEHAHGAQPPPGRPMMAPAVAERVRLELPAPHQITRHISGRILLLVKKRGMLCHWCGKSFRLNVDAAHPLAPTREHLLPKSLGGQSHDENIALVHGRCNQIRGTIDAEAFGRLMRGEALTREELWPHHFEPP